MTTPNPDEQQPPVTPPATTTTATPPPTPTTTPATPPPAAPTELDTLKTTLATVQQQLADYKNKETEAQKQKEKDAEAELVKNNEHKTLAEQRAAKIAELEAEVARRDQEALKAKVAAKHKLPEAAIARLQGKTEAELEADAKELAKLVVNPNPPAGNGRNPRPAGSQQNSLVAPAGFRAKF